MLTDDLRQLLASYVDGELTNRQRKAALRLLRRSAEARALLRQMQEDAERLRLMPRRTPAPDFTLDVLHTIVERKLRPRHRRPARPAAGGIPGWAGLAAAAAVLLVVGFGSYLYFTAALPGQDDGRAGRPVPKKERPDGGRQVADAPPRDTDPGPRGGGKADPPERIPPPEAVASGSKERDRPKGSAGQPPPAVDAAPPDPLPKLEMFQPGDVKLAAIFRLAELDQAAQRGRLEKLLREDRAFRLELPCKQGVRAFERWQAALKAHGIHLIIEEAARTRMKFPQLRTNFVLYVEDVTAEELARMVLQVAEADRQAGAKPQGGGQFEALVVQGMTADDRKELSKLLKVDAARLQAPPGKPDRAKPMTPPAGRLALALPYNPIGPRPGSPEVKRFRDARKPPRPGTLQVLLVLRETPG
ncbi:MAG TPA: hypothetical protein VFA26_01915 [Gemmataceae bacterium]|nr:hypothetical protein [Gemmataceae bacterium]